MELILISNTKLKIMLDESDMREYRIGDDSDCAEPETRRAIRTLLDKAKNEIGFNTDGSEIFVQLYTSRKGGCELFVTKSNLSEPLTSASSAYSEIEGDNHSTEKRLKRREAITKHAENKPMTSHLPEYKERAKLPMSHQGGRMAFSFDSMESLLSVCQALDHMGVYPQSRAFSDGENWYLLLSDTETSAFARLDRLTFILEYGRRENPDCLTTYINEHGQLICDKNAIKTLGILKA
jgi:negative regulator of genetic competence, sporulation and motility